VEPRGESGIREWNDARRMNGCDTAASKQGGGDQENRPYERRD
jgi:hypothetical protein